MQAAGDSSLQWTAAVRGCPQRVNHAAVALGPHVFSFGGYSSSRSARLWHSSRIDVLRLNVHSLRWSDVTESTDCPLVDGQHQPAARYGHSAVRHSGTALLFGGRNDDTVAQPDVWQFCAEPLCWRLRPATGHVPLGRDGHAACVLRKCMIVFGGFTAADEYDDQLYSCDLELWQWTRLSASNEPPSARDFCCSAAWGSGLFVWGGRSDEAGVVHSGNARYDPEVHHFDLDTRRWSRAAVGPLPAGRRSGVMFRLLDCLYFGFGFSEEADDGHLSDLWRLDVGSGRVTPALPSRRLCDGPCPRRRLAAVPLGRARVLLFGGTCAAYSFRPPVDAASYRRLYAPLLPLLPAFRHHCAQPALAVAPLRRDGGDVGVEGNDDEDGGARQTGHQPPAQRDDFLRELEEPDNSSLGLKDISDMFLLEAQPSLQTLCVIQVIRHRLPLHTLHALLQEDILSRISDNCISPVT